MSNNKMLKNVLIGILIALVAIIIVIIILLITGKKDTNSRNEIQNHVVEIENDANVLAKDMTTIPMGTCIDGEQQQLCEVNVPAEYRVSFGEYMSPEGDREIIDGTTSTDLQDIKEEGLLENMEEQINRITIHSKDTDNVLVYTIADIHIEEIQEQYPDGMNIGTEEHPAYCGLMKDNPNNPQVFLVYVIDENYELEITYQGDLIDTLDTEEIGNMLYDFIITE